MRALHGVLNAMAHNVLVLSRFFPPMFDVGGKRAYRFARYLPNLGWNPTVLTSPVPQKRAVDSTPLDLPSSARIVRRYTPPFSREATGRMSDGTVTTPVASTPKDQKSSLWSAIRPYTKPPVDGQIAWVPHIVREAMSLLRTQHFDAIFATSSPYSVLVAGTILSKLSGVPLILDLRDPWTLNFLHTRRAPWLQSIESWVERAVFTHARRITLTCPSAAQAYRDLYPHCAQKILSITNSFDPVNAPPNIDLDPQRPIQLVHFGNCYGPRRMATVIRAISLLKSRDAIPPQGLSLLNLGRVAQDDVELAEHLNVREHLSWKPVVPYQDGLSILASCDLQILLSYGHETLFIPAKFFDYLLTQSPILCLSERSDLTDAIEDTQSGLWASPNDVEGCADIILRAIQARTPDAPPVSTPNPDAIARYASPSTARELVDVLNSIVD